MYVHYITLDYVMTYIDVYTVYIYIRLYNDLSIGNIHFCCRSSTICRLKARSGELCEVIRRSREELLDKIAMAYKVRNT